MRVLIVGAGAREHALAWRLAQDRGPADLVCAPGNPGIASLARCEPVDLADPGAILELAQRERADLTVVGPEQPLAAGVADRFATAGRPLFGPGRLAAELESSKAFAKDFMVRHRIPTADYCVCDSEAEAIAALDDGRFGFPVVLKADGLAAGKGVVVAADRSEAMTAVRAAMRDRRFGAAGARMVVETCLIGTEVSFFAICDGQRAVPLVSAQDHKRVFDHDQGPNTGGMGAFAPSPLMDEASRSRVMREVIEPTVSGMAAEGRAFRGLLYAGLMMTADGPQVIEFNVRFGDPEAQVVLPMVSGELLPVLAGAASGDLSDASVPVRDDRHVGVVLASGGYPGEYETGRPIEGVADVERSPDTFVFQAGTAIRDGRLVTSGGRVLTVVGRGASFSDAIARAYRGADRITFEGKHARRDIGRRALES